MTIKEIVKGRRGTILDVRNPFELQEGAVPGAINIPVGELPFRIDEIKRMTGPLVVYCRSGSRSGMAIALLKSAGIDTEMYNGGGYTDMLTYLN
jgi:rhodanese-related sulfurtransferase